MRLFYDSGTRYRVVNARRGAEVELIAIPGNFDLSHVGYPYRDLFVCKYATLNDVLSNPLNQRFIVTGYWVIVSGRRWFSDALTRAHVSGLDGCSQVLVDLQPDEVGELVHAFAQDFATDRWDNIEALRLNKDEDLLGGGPRYWLANYDSGRNSNSNARRLSTLKSMEDSFIELSSCLVLNEVHRLRYLLKHYQPDPNFRCLLFLHASVYGGPLLGLDQLAKDIGSLGPFAERMCIVVFGGGGLDQKWQKAILDASISAKMDGQIKVIGEAFGADGEGPSELFRRLIKAFKRDLEVGDLSWSNFKATDTGVGHDSLESLLPLDILSQGYLAVCGQSPEDLPNPVATEIREIPNGDDMLRRARESRAQIDRLVRAEDGSEGWFDIAVETLKSGKATEKQYWEDLKNRAVGRSNAIETASRSGMYALRYAQHLLSPSSTEGGAGLVGEAVAAVARLSAYLLDMAGEKHDISREFLSQASSLSPSHDEEAVYRLVCLGHIGFQVIALVFL